MMNQKQFRHVVCAGLLVWLVGVSGIQAAAKEKPVAVAEVPRVTYHTTAVDGVKIFYRESGSPANPTIVLLHGFPSSSHMYRELIPRLASRYHVIAPDYPGFGNSDAPSVDDFAYTFDHLAAIMDDFLDSIQVTRYSIYIQDYGSPIGFRLATKHPEKIQAIITQNGNAYDEGLTPFWAENLKPFWDHRNAENEAKLRGLLTLEGTKFQYTKGIRSETNVSPDSWTTDQAGLDRPGNQEIQLALFYDYRNNLALYPSWHQYLRDRQPPVLIVWGKNDPIFGPEGAKAFLRDVPSAELHLLDTGHFALEEDSQPIAEYILAFLKKAGVKK